MPVLHTNHTLFSTVACEFRSIVSKTLGDWKMSSKSDMGLASLDVDESLLENPQKNFVKLIRSVVVSNYQLEFLWG